MRVDVVHIRHKVRHKPAGRRQAVGGWRLYHARQGAAAAAMVHDALGQVAGPAGTQGARGAGVTRWPLTTKGPALFLYLPICMYYTCIYVLYLYICTTPLYMYYTSIYVLHLYICTTPLYMYYTYLGPDQVPEGTNL